MVQLEVVSCFQLVTDEYCHSGYDPAVAPAPVCVDLDCLFVVSLGFCDVDVCRVPPVVEFHVKVDLLRVFFVSIFRRSS